MSMANRKLQAEIDRVMKQISEGLGKFKEIWEKQQEAGTQNLKDKYEGELKKEIKKLQKLRDQLKSWAGSSDVKNKQPLYDARKSIEVEMERFKVLERESKTKAYSKEGLAQNQKKQKSGPVIERNRPTYKWIDEKVEMLEQQIEDMKEMSEDASEAKKEEYAMWIERHNYHLKELEKTKERMENSDLTKEQVEELVDEIDFYCESNQDADFFYDEQLYSVLDEYCQERQEAREAGTLVDELDVTSVGVASPAEISGANRSPASSPGKKDSGGKKKQEEEKQKALLLQQQQEMQKKQALLAKQQQQALLQQQAQAAAAAMKQQQQQQQQRLNKQQQQQQKKLLLQQQQQQAQAAKQQQMLEQQKLKQQRQQQQQQQQKQGSQSSSKNNSVPNSNRTTPRPSPSHQPMPTPSGQGSNQSALANSTNAVDQAYLGTLKLLAPSYNNLPTISDSDRPKQYVPRNPYRTPACFPSVPAPIFDDPASFEKFGTDALFFIFYFQQGTPHQYLAARELKKQSWRYHKNFLTWFQRHEDPSTTTDEYEQGTYVYFDYETGWCQRIKADFTFEYKHLEDELFVPT